MSDLVRANAFVLPAGSGWYRYHALFADVLRLKLRHESPDLVPELHRRAAGWYRRNGLLTQAVRHAAAAGDWQLAARIVVGELAVGRLTETRGDHSLADEFTRMRPAQAWTTPEPLLVAAALALAEDRPASTWLAAAEGMLGALPPAEATPARLAMSSSGASAPFSANASVAAATSRARFCLASARNCCANWRNCGTVMLARWVARSLTAPV